MRSDKEGAGIMPESAHGFLRRGFADLTGAVERPMADEAWGSEMAETESAILVSSHI